MSQIYGDYLKVPNNIKKFRFLKIPTGSEGNFFKYRNTPFYVNFRISSISAGVTTIGVWGKCFLLPVTK